MADNKQNKRPNVPPLRFPEFAGEWERTKLGNHITIYSGSSPNLIVEENGEIPYYKVEQLNWCDKYLSDTPYLSKRNKLTLPPNCIVFSKRGAAILTNKVRINPFAINIDTNLMGISVNDSSSLDCNFLYYFILKAELGKIADTSTIPQINNIHINPLIIPIPSIGEQRKVAKFISLLDHRIAVQSKLIEQLESLIKGISQQVFSQFSSFEKLGDVATITNGNSDVQDATEIYEQGLFPFYDRSYVMKYLSSFYLEKEAIIYAGEGSEFYPRYHNGKFALHQRCYAIFDFNDDFLPKFVYYFMFNLNSYFVRNAVGSTVPSLRMGTFEKVNIPKVPKEKQLYIVKVFDCLHMKLNKTKELIKMHEKQKQYLLQQMFI